MRRALTAAQRAALERLLEAHEPADDVERRHVEHVQRFAARHADPYDRAIAEGHLTGSAFVFDPAGRLLLTHHRRLDIWIQVGGHAEEEREAPLVALREAREESGLDDLRFCDRLVFDDGAPRLLDVDVHDIPATPREPAHQHLDLRFVLRTDQPDRIVADPRETRALEWVSPEEARRRGDPGMQRALARLS